MKQYPFCRIALPFLLLLLISCGKSETVHHGVFAPSRLDAIAGQDGVSPVTFDRHTTIWTFADTMIGSKKEKVSVETTFLQSHEIKRMLSNSLAFSSPLKKSNITDLPMSFYREKGEVAPFIKLRKDENPFRNRIWPFDGIRLGNRIYFYYVLITVTEPKKYLGFQVDHTGLARWDIPSGWKPGDPMEVERLGRLFSGDYPFWGTSVLQHEGWLYLTGHHPDPSTGKTPVRIARVRPEMIEKSDSYRYLGNDGNWIDDLSDAEGYPEDTMGECSLSYNSKLKRFILVYCQAGSGNIMAVTFSSFKKIRQGNSAILYRPEPLASDKGEWPKRYYTARQIMATGDSLWVIYIHPEKYQPMLIEAPLDALH